MLPGPPAKLGGGNVMLGGILGMLRFGARICISLG